MTNQELIEIAKSVSGAKKLTEGASAGGVGSALMTKDGNVYKGKCIDCSCGIGFCAEHSAIASMLTAGESQIKTIVAATEEGVVLPPCGRCRELISQVDTKNLETDIIISKNKTVKLKDILEYRWLDTYQPQDFE